MIVIAREGPSLSVLDVAFWLCAFVALTGSTALAAIGLFVWRSSRAPVVRGDRARAPRLGTRHFGRTYRAVKQRRFVLALR
jgi:hypothetical protein